MQPNDEPQPQPAPPVRPRAMMDVVPPRQLPQTPVLSPAAAAKQTIPSTPAAATPQPVAPQPVPQPTELLKASAVQPQPIDGKQPKPKRKKWLIALIIVAILAAIAVASVVAAKVWYDTQLTPVSSDEKAARVRVTIEKGSTPEQIGKTLQDAGAIRSSFAFLVYTRLNGVQNSLQAGSFNLNPHEPLASIVDHLVAGKTDEFSITFLPGDTLAGHRQVLIQAGYSQQEVDAALAKQYQHPLLAGKPASADLEGYIYGETYNFAADATVEQILTRTFDEYYQQLQHNDLLTGFQKQGLTTYQAITLASIIQREVANEADEKQVAQVFFKRLRAGGMLGSDVTFIYAAKKMGVKPTPELDSPYNTRIHPGLPPGPIASPGLSALKAVAAPAAGEYQYFLAGDDGKTYFAYTYEQHTANIVNHCQKLCSE